MFSYIWMYHDWGVCSKTCGKGGLKTKTSGCFRELKNMTNKGIFIYLNIFTRKLGNLT